MKLGTVKPSHAVWVITFYKQMQSSETIIKSGFQKGDINEVVTEVSTNRG